MTLTEILEFIGMVSTMGGAFMITSKNEKTRFYGLFSFIVANYTVFAFASMKGLLPLQIQMVFFLIATSPALKNYTNNWKIIRNSLFVFTVVYATVMIMFVDMKISSTHIPIVELMAAGIAVLGSYLQKYKVSDIRVISFMMFFIADVLYVIISIENTMLFFGIQSLFFWYTSIKGISNELNKKESFKDWIIRSLNLNLKRI